MKKFIITVSLLVAAYFVWDAIYFRIGVYIDFRPNEYVTTFTRTDRDKIYIDRGNGFEEFEIRGVNMGSGEPGQWATDFSIDKETYKCWFQYIKEMGANTIRVYTIQSSPFYNAFYEFNQNNPDPLYLLHGVWVNDYIQNSHRDAFDDQMLGVFIKDCKTVVDVIHGNKKLSLGRVASAGHGSYLNDISPWVIGYILGVEWEDVTVVYTDEKYMDNPAYEGYAGKYMYTTKDATPFESMLARVGDKIIEYESERYKQQRILAFSNWPTTDPFEYPDYVAHYFCKCAQVDVEHIACTEAFLAGQFASYHVYPYYPDYLRYLEDWSDFGLGDHASFLTEDGAVNTYRAYLTLLSEYHKTMPVVISEYGVSTGRGMAHRDVNTGRNQGNMSENDQGQALIECYEDIMASGCVGSCVFSWQDEWFKRTWNTMHAVDLTRTPYWSDYQTNEQYFGLLSFDPGKERSVCYVDGDFSEWTDSDIISERRDLALSMKYDEKFVYFLLKKPDWTLGGEKIYIAFDITPNSGVFYVEEDNLCFNKGADFLLVVDGEDNSRLTVQERYEALRANYCQEVYQFDTYLVGNEPEKNSDRFVNIDLVLDILSETLYNIKVVSSDTFETGLLTYGNANPYLPDFNSLADFCAGENGVEIKLPWQLLNFADPSRMMIHDDYYNGNYGIEFMHIDIINVGAGTIETPIIYMDKVELEGWGNRVTYHERLKKSYYIMKNLWNP